MLALGIEGTARASLAPYTPRTISIISLKLLPRSSIPRDRDIRRGPKLRMLVRCVSSRRKFDNLGGDFFLPESTFRLGEADELRFDVRLR